MRPGGDVLVQRGRREAGRLTPSGSGSISRRDPWAAGTQTVPLPPAIQGSPLRGLSAGSGPISAPSVLSQRCGTCSVPGEREEGGSWGEASLKIFDPGGVDELATPRPPVSPAASDLVPLRGTSRRLTGP